MGYSAMSQLNALTGPCNRMSLLWIGCLKHFYLGSRRNRVGLKQ